MLNLDLCLFKSYLFNGSLNLEFVLSSLWLYYSWWFFKKMLNIELWSTMMVTDLWMLAKSITLATIWILSTLRRLTMFGSVEPYCASWRYCNLWGPWNSNTYFSPQVYYQEVRVLDITRNLYMIRGVCFIIMTIHILKPNKLHRWLISSIFIKNIKYKKTEAPLPRISSFKMIFHFLF